MAYAHRHRNLAAPLLGVNLVVYIILLGLASWAFDEMIDGHLYGMNAVTSDLIRYSLLAGVVGLASVLAGLFHHRHGRAETHSGATSLALLALLLDLLALGMACKQIHIGLGHSDHAHGLKTLAAFTFIASALQLLYVLLMHGYVYD